MLCSCLVALSEGNDLNPLWGLGRHERRATVSEEAEGHKALFRILQADVLTGERRPLPGEGTSQLPAGRSRTPAEIFRGLVGCPHVLRYGQGVAGRKVSDPLPGLDDRPALDFPSPGWSQPIADHNLAQFDLGKVPLGFLAGERFERSARIGLALDPCHVLHRERGRPLCQLIQRYCDLGAGKIVERERVLPASAVLRPSHVLPAPVNGLRRLGLPLEALRVVLVIEDKKRAGLVVMPRIAQPKNRPEAVRFRVAGGRTTAA